MVKKGRLPAVWTEMLGKPARYQHPRWGRNWTLELQSRWLKRTVIFPWTGHIIADFTIIYNSQSGGGHLSLCVILRIVVPLASLLIKFNPEDQNPKLTSSPSKKQKEWGSKDKVTLRFFFYKILPKPSERSLVSAPIQIQSENPRHKFSFCSCTIFCFVKDTHVVNILKRVAF